MEAKCSGYDSLGNVCYTITENWRVVNDRYPTVYLSTNSIHTVKICGGLSIPITNFISSPPGFPPSTISLSNSDYLFTISYNVCVPPGVSCLETELGYRDTPTLTNNSNTSRESEHIQLIPCVCDYCGKLERQIDAQITESLLLHSNTHSMYDELAIKVDFVHPNPLYRVNVEIIDYEHYVDNKNPVCSALCNKNDDSYGTFTEGPLLISYHPIFINYINRMIPFAGWKNNGYPYSYSNNDGSSISRELVWESDGVAGVNISGSFQILTIGLPEFNKCCEDNFRLCLRYSFTDTKCRVCDKVVCYKFNRNDKSITVLSSKSDSTMYDKKQLKFNIVDEEKKSFFRLNNKVKNQ